MKQSVVQTKNGYGKFLWEFNIQRDVISLPHLIYLFLSGSK